MSGELWSCGFKHRVIYHSANSREVAAIMKRGDLFIVIEEKCPESRCSWTYVVSPMASGWIIKWTDTDVKLTP